MLDQLVESRSNAGDSVRRGGFLLTTLVVVVSLFLGALLYSLFKKDFGLGGSDLELSTLVAPVPVPAEEPPPPEPEQKPEKQVTEKVERTDVPMRTTNTQDISEAPKDIPQISTQQTSVKARPQGTFVLGNKDTEGPAGPVGPVRESTGGGGGGLAQTQPVAVEKSDDEPPPPKPKPTPPPVPKKVSLGVINGKASRLVTPPYPPAAKAVRASGAVNVSVSIDVNGNVTSASAVSGHPLLRQAAEQAARASKFTPTVLSGQPVPVTGIIVYNFVAQ